MSRLRSAGGAQTARLGLLLVLLVTLGVAAGCGREPETVEILVPAGTQDRLGAGEEVVIMPAELRFRVGDTLVIRNEDRVAQTVGPYLVMAGETVELTYGRPGRYEGMCPLSEGETYLIEVTE